MLKKLFNKKYQRAGPSPSNQVLGWQRVFAGWWCCPMEQECYLAYSKVETTPSLQPNDKQHRSSL